MNEVGKAITNKLIEIHGSRDFTIGFLPYKRSMWNCMSSVYAECKAAGATVYCLPIPYYRMKGRRVVDRMDYEREYFSEAQPISLLEVVDLDYLVIHYPYDSNNVVTNMLPEYYTEQLKKYGEVIYIPYTCTSGRQFRVQPGIANVDYAFLPSEADAVAFVQEWAELGVDFSGRVFGYGSPKMDIIPKLPRGSATLVLNSLAPFLYSPVWKMNQYKSVMMEELEKGHEVIFRPHPLLSQTIKSIQPDMGLLYRDLISWIHNHDVFLDEGEDLENTLAHTGYLISDPSSVLEMWKSTGREYRVL